MQEYIKKILGLSKQNNRTTLIISNDKIKYIIEISKSHEDSGLLLKRLSKTIHN